MRLTIKAAPTLVTSRPTQSEFAAFLRAQDAELERAISRLVSGAITPEEWYRLMDELLVQGHAGARALGRQRAGDLLPLDVEDYLAGRAIADTESEFLLAFLEALEGLDPRYWDVDERAWKPQAIRNRARLYVQKMRGTSGQAFVSASGGDAEFNWVLAAVEHCDECPVLAAKSPWFGDELYTTPGNGDTPCRSNCKCHLVRKSDGLTSFKPVRLS